MRAGILRDAVRCFGNFPAPQSVREPRRRVTPNQSHASSFAASPIASIALIPVQSRGE